MEDFRRSGIPRHYMRMEVMPTSGVLFHAFRPRKARSFVALSALSGTCISGPHTPLMRIDSPRPAAISDTPLHVRVSHRRIGAGCGREVPTVDDQIETQEPLDRGPEVGPAEVSVVFQGGLCRIVQNFLHRIADGRPGCRRVVVDRRTGCQFQADYLDHVSFAVEHVSHHVAGGPALAGGIVVPAVGGYGVDPGRESGSQIPITLGGGRSLLKS